MYMNKINGIWMVQIANEFFAFIFYMYLYFSIMSGGGIN